MDNQQSGNIEMIGPAGEYGRLLDAANVCLLCCLLDDGLSILWASNCFYQKTGYAREEYQRLFQTVRQYYADYPDDFLTMKKLLEQDSQTARPTVPFPKKDGVIGSVQLAWSFAEKSLEGRRVCYLCLLYTSARKEREGGSPKPFQ